MKKFAILFIILICLSFNVTIISSLAETVSLKEGLYKSSDLKLASNNTYTIQNLSSDDSSYILIFNQDNVVQQSLRLQPKSQKYNLLPLQPEYRIVIVGGDILIS